MRSANLREPSASSKFDRLIAALCQEHYDCLRYNREEKPSSQQRFTFGSRLSGDYAGDNEFWPQSSLTVAQAPGRRRPTHPAPAALADVALQSSTSADWSREKFRNVQSLPNGYASEESSASATWGIEKSVRPVHSLPNLRKKEILQTDEEQAISLGVQKVMSTMVLDSADQSVRASTMLGCQSLTHTTSRGKYFEVRMAWEQDWGMCPSTYSVLSGNQDSVDGTSEHRKYRSLADAFVLHPNSRKRLAWNMMCFLFIVYDIIVVPLQAFSFEDVKVIEIADWVIRCFWTVDMVGSCFSGFYLKGRLYMHFNATLYQYVSTWFSLDLLLVVSDWVIHFMTAETSLEYGKMLRFARGARIIRLLRLFKLRGLLHTIEDIIDTENVAIYFQCLKPFFAVGLLTHVLACGWFGIGRWDDSYHYNWVEYAGVLERSKGYQYATCLHWSLAQFTLNTMDVYSHNLGERLYTIAVGLFGIIGFSVLVSGFTSAAEQLREIKSDETKQFWMLRRFFRDYSISHKLASRVMRYCEYAYIENKARIQPEDVSLMKLLSEPLRQELGMEINLPQLTPHPFFLKMQQLRYRSLKMICFNLSPRSYARGDSFLTKGEDSTGMIMLTEGEASYTYTDATCKQCQRLWSGEWLCEPSLWTHWKVLGNAKAEVHSRVLVVLADMMERVFVAAPFNERLYVQRHAQKFVAMLNMLSRDHLTDIVETVHPSDASLGASAGPDMGVLEFFVKNIGRRFSMSSKATSSTEDQQVATEAQSSTMADTSVSETPEVFFSEVDVAANSHQEISQPPSMQARYGRIQL